MALFAYGVDIGGTAIKIGLFTEEGRLKDTVLLPTRLEDKGCHILNDIKDAIFQNAEKHGIKITDIIGVGIGVPGPVLADGSAVRCINLGWGVTNVEKQFQIMSGLKTKVANDANAAALGEYIRGGGKDFNSMFFVSIGTGIGGALILDGKIINGSMGAAGEIGHLHVNDEETVPCSCGNVGCLEQYVSGTGIARMAKKYLEDNKEEETSLRKVRKLDCKAVFDAAIKGDSVAEKIVDESASIMGNALATVGAVINPDVFVIGGGVSLSGDYYIPLLRKYYMKYAFHATKNAEIRKASLGNQAGIYGTVNLVLK